MRPSLVIFDCDGVLVDTEPMSNALMAEVLQAEGMQIDAAGSTARFVGKSMKSVQKEVETELGRPLGADWAERFHKQTITVFRERGVAAIPGVRQAIAAIDAAGIPICVASSGSIEKMHASLGASGLLDQLRDVLFTADRVARGKPAPDLFLHAASEMGHPPEACVVIEDSRFGVEAAVAAGMRALAFVAAPNARAADMAALGGVLFDDMAQLPGLLGLEVSP
ncbi:MAG: HAD-IA family hydrolase [Pseudomonadota bacterium]